MWRGKQEKEIDEVEKLDFSKKGFVCFPVVMSRLEKKKYSLCFVLFSGGAVETFGSRETQQNI